MDVLCCVALCRGVVGWFDRYLIRSGLKARKMNFFIGVQRYIHTHTYRARRSELQNGPENNIDADRERINRISNFAGCVDCMYSMYREVPRHSYANGNLPNGKT
jgi:hypothetical protein